MNELPGPSTLNTVLEATESVSVGSVGPETGSLVSTGLWHLDDPGRFSAFVAATTASRLAPGQGRPGQILNSARPVWVENVSRRDMGRLWQAAGTVKSVLEQPGLLERAVDSGLRSLFVGFETVNAANLTEQHKYQNIGRNYGIAIERLHALGVMVNGSFVFGMDGDDADVFDRTVDWAINAGIETATFHILTPYPDTALYQRMEADGRLLHHDWDQYDTRHVVFKPANMTPETLLRGYWRAYRDFYRWSSIWRGAATKNGVRERMRHIAYAGGWKKFEPTWNVIIRSRQVLHALPVLEMILSGFGTHRARRRRLLELPAGFDAGLDGHLVGADLHRLRIAHRSPSHGSCQSNPPNRL